MREVTQVRAFCDFTHVGPEEINAQTVRVGSGWHGAKRPEVGRGQWADSSMARVFGGEQYA